VGVVVCSVMVVWLVDGQWPQIRISRRRQKPGIRIGSEGQRSAVVLGARPVQALELWR